LLHKAESKPIVVVAEELRQDDTRGERLLNDPTTVVARSEAEDPTSTLGSLETRGTSGEDDSVLP
jgi:hypothetical protein